MNNIEFPSNYPVLAARAESLLVLCYYDPFGVSTVPETVAFIQKCSSYSISVINLFEHKRSDGSLRLSQDFNINKFNGVIIHNSLSYNVDNLRILDQLLEVSLKEYSGLKVLMKQDENFRFKEMAQYIGDIGFDVIFTCLPTEAVSVVYPKSVVGEPIFYRMLTGYVTPTLRNIQNSNNERDIDIGYRGSIQPLNFGRLAYEKRKIGYDIQQRVSAVDFSLNISSRWEDRLGAGAWLEFLLRCKSTLGAESGASIFDLDETLEKRCAQAEKTLGHYCDDPDYAENYLSFLADLEGNVNYNQISPRHFEAAATKTLQIMYPGEYSGIFRPGVHYVELYRDYSNLDDVLSFIKDNEKREKIVEQAYQDIIVDSKYWIETFVENFDFVLARAFNKKHLAIKPDITLGRGKKNVLLLCAHKPSIDPRLGWVADYAPEDLFITQIGVLSPTSKESQVLRSDDGHAIFAKPRIFCSEKLINSWAILASGNELAKRVVLEFQFIEKSLNLPNAAFLELFGAPDSPERVQNFKWYLRYFLDTAATILDQVQSMRGFSLVVATDLDSLLVALLIKGICDVPVVYDAHEYWPEADISSFEFEKEYWMQLEKWAVQQTDLNQTVSSGLAKLMAKNYGVHFDFVPNCEPLSIAKDLSVSKRSENESQIKFIFQGNFALGRGIDLLINSWPSTVNHAVLLLRGPDNEYKSQMIDLAKKTGLLGTRIIFLDAVSESELVLSAREGHVGVIPYTPYGANYSHCCPNKMSQYMAASLPILANNTSFVSSIVKRSQCGVVVDFSREGEIAEAVNLFANNSDLRVEMAEKANQFFLHEFHWEYVSQPMYDAMINLVKNNHKKALRVFPGIKKPSLYSQKQLMPELIETKKSAIFSYLYGYWLRLPVSVRKILKPIFKRILFRRW